jgi:hypothetical protein
MGDDGDEVVLVGNCHSQVLHGLRPINGRVANRAVASSSISSTGVRKGELAAVRHTRPCWTPDWTD